MRRLDCLVISTGRAASTAVYTYLDKMATLGLPANKEPHFWCNIEQYSGRYKLLNKLYVNDPLQYEHLYSNSKLIVDASVGYFFCMQEVAQKLKYFQQRPKILFLYRDPMSRAISLFNELTRKGIETEPDVTSAIRVAYDRSAGQWWERYYDNVNYNTVFQTARDAAERLLAINYDAFAHSPHESMKKVLRFLDVIPTEYISYTPINTSEWAIISHKTRGLHWLSPVFPKRLRLFIKKWLSSNQTTLEMPNENLSEFLPNSIKEYGVFRKYLGDQDYYDTADN